MKNCGLRFHSKIAQKDFLNDLTKVIQAKVCINPFIKIPLRMNKPLILMEGEGRSFIIILLTDFETSIKAFRRVLLIGGNLVLNFPLKQ